MRALEIVVVVLGTVLALTWAARRIRVSEPVLLLVGGVLIGLIPRFHSLHVPSDVVLLIFLPPLLYAEALTISLRQIRQNLRVIVLLSVALVIVTALTVGTTAQALGLAGPMAFALGAVLAPTDATAVASVARGMPRRMLATMKAESLVNDGTALVLFAVAVDIAVGRHSFSWGFTVWRFVVGYAGGAAIGAGIAGLVILIRRHLDDPVLGTGLSLLTPFAAYLPAEQADVSGVLAVVVCGLMISWASPLLIHADARVQTMAFWELAIMLLNGALFVLVGIQLPGAVQDLRSMAGGRAVALAAAVFGTVLLTRVAYIYTTPYLIRALDRRPQQRARRVGARQRAPMAWGGVRGAVSLAAALAVPAVARDGSPLAGRDVIVFVTGMVIAATLVFQGQTLPAVIRWARLPPDPDEHGEELLARQRVVDSALEELPALGRSLGAPDEVVHRLAGELREHAAELGRREGPVRHAEHELRQALLVVKRTALVGLRDERLIDDAVLRRVQETLDAEELRLNLRIATAHHAPHRSSAHRHEAPAVERPGQKGEEPGDA